MIKQLRHCSVDCKSGCFKFEAALLYSTCISRWTQVLFCGELLYFLPSFFFSSTSVGLARVWSLQSPLISLYLFPSLSLPFSLLFSFLCSSNFFLTFSPAFLPFLLSPIVSILFLPPHAFSFCVSTFFLPSFFLLFLHLSPVFFSLSFSLFLLYGKNIYYSKSRVA